MLCCALLVALSPAVPARPAPPPATPTPKSVVRFEMQLTRADSDEKTPAPAPLVLAAPIVSTLDGQTATIAVNAPQTSNDLSYNIALSPTLGKGNNDNTVEVLWSLRLSGKTIPGAASASLSGAVRISLGKEATIGEIALADPQTGKRTVFRLTSKTTREDSAKTP